jgi:ubiquinone/menaquinone biosynthesis C-methylase UbiE
VTLSAAVLSSPRLYDWVQRAAGIERSRRRLAPVLAQLDGSVLDVGAGTGAWVDLLPASADYLGVDLDETKLARLRARHPGRRTVAGDATSLPFPDRSFDHALCIALAHHLDDARLPLLFRELARVTRRRVVFLEPVRAERWRSRALWAIDRGSWPRTADALASEFARQLRVDAVDRFAVNHEYVLVIGSSLGEREGAAGPPHTAARPGSHAH